MSLQDKPLTNAQLQKATSRRSRKDEEGRDFQCGCGKRYLSYPALYTHIKTKHDGRQPEGTQKTGTNPNIKRPKSRIEQQNLKNILSYMQRQDLKLLSQLDQFHLGKVSLNSRIKKQNVPKEIYECYNQLIKDQHCKLTRKSSLDLVLTVYLLNVGNFVNQKLFEHFLLFVRIVRSCYLQSGQEAYRHCFNNPENNKQYILGFSNSQIRCFPIICDYFLRYYVGVCELAKGYKQINLSLMQLMIYDLCAWLFRNKMTHIRVTLKKQYRLECKLVAITNLISSDQKDLLKEKESQQQDQISNSEEIIQEDSQNQINSIEPEEFQPPKEKVQNNIEPIQVIKNAEQIKLHP